MQQSLFKQISGLNIEGFKELVERIRSSREDKK
jgi:hypothetical protein